MVFTVMPSRSELLGQRAGQADDRAFGRGVGRHLLRAGLRAGGGDVHHPAPVRRFHVGQGLLRHDDRAEDVDLVNEAEEFLGDLLERREVGDAGVVHDDGDRAEGGPQLGHRGLHLAAVGHVGTERDGLAAFRLDRRDRVGAPRLIEVKHAHGDAVLREPPRTGRSDARRCAGNECHFGGCHLTFPKRYRSVTKSRSGAFWRRNALVSPSSPPRAVRTPPLRGERPAHRGRPGRKYRRRVRPEPPEPRCCRSRAAWLRGAGPGPPRRQRRSGGWPKHVVELVRQSAPEKRPASKGMLVASAFTTSTLVPASRAARVSASAVSSSTAVTGEPGFARGRW